MTYGTKDGTLSGDIKMLHWLVAAGQPGDYGPGGDCDGRGGERPTEEY